MSQVWAAQSTGKENSTRAKSQLQRRELSALTKPVVTEVFMIINIALLSFKMPDSQIPMFAGFGQPFHSGVKSHPTKYGDGPDQVGDSTHEHRL